MTSTSRISPSFPAEMPGSILVMAPSTKTMLWTRPLAGPASPDQLERSVRPSAKERSEHVSERRVPQATRQIYGSSRPELSPSARAGQKNDPSWRVCLQKSQGLGRA